MIKKVTKNFIVYMSDALQILFVRCRHSGKFAKHNLARLELENMEKYSAMSALFICFMSLFNAIVVMADLDIKQVLLFNIVGASAILLSFFIAFMQDLNEILN